MRWYFHHNRTRYSVLVAALVLVVACGVGVVVALQMQPPRLPEPSLKQLADQHNVQVGNFAIRTRIYEAPYAAILTGQFHFAVADNTPNWYFTDGGLRPDPESYSFAQMDEVVGFAEQYAMPVQAHHYLWGEEKWLPAWLKDGGYSKEQLQTFIEDHIKTVGGRYKGRIREWTVVNEAFSRNLHMYGLRDWWADHTGGLAYIDQAFIWARQVDPDAVHILNDFQNEAKNDISDAMYTYIKDARARGVPIDGVGMQMHIDGVHPPIKDEVIANMKRFGDLGVAVYVTEFDVNMNDVQADASDKNRIQANIYYEMLRACIESRVCHSFALLGITDKETWYNYMGLSDARPLPFDAAYNPKPAFFSLRHALEQP